MQRPQVTRLCSHDVFAALSNSFSSRRNILWLLVYVFVSLWSGSHAASSPTGQPSTQPTIRPSTKQTPKPTLIPVPTRYPTNQPSNQPSNRPSRRPSRQPTSHPSKPSGQPTSRPTMRPSFRKITLSPMYTSVVLQVGVRIIHFPSIDIFSTLLLLLSFPFLSSPPAACR